MRPIKLLFIYSLIITVSSHDMGELKKNYNIVFSTLPDSILGLTHENLYQTPS